MSLYFNNILASGFQVKDFIFQSFDEYFLNHRAYIN